MRVFRIGPAALATAALLFSAVPTAAEQGERRRPAGQDRPQAVERARPRQGGEPRTQVVPNRGPEARRFDSRAYGNRGASGNRGDSRYGYDRRAYEPSRPYAYRPRAYDYRPYTYRPYVRHSYVVPYGYRPYGYRPYGYRPGWSLNLYFGRPYTPYYGYQPYGPPAAYGYYALPPGLAYGSLRIVGAPRDARVFVDGYYAGVVDDYDGVFQQLNLEAGAHRVEIEVPGYPPQTVDVRIEPGRTLTYRAYF